MHSEPDQSPQPDPAGAGQPPEPVPQDSSSTVALKDAISERARAEVLGLLVKTLEGRMAAVPIPDDPVGEAGQKYDALIAWYKKHIAAAQARLMAMRH